VKSQLVLFLSLTGLSIVPACGADDWKEALEAGFKREIQFSKLTLDGAIAVTGTKYLLKTENIHAMPTNGYLPNINVIENGARHEANVGTRALTGILNASTRKTSGTQIDVGTEVGIQKLSIGKDSVSIQVVTLRQTKVETKGTTQSEYLYTILEFPFKNLPSMDPAGVKQVIYATLLPQGTSSGAQGTTSAASQLDLAAVVPVPAKAGSNDLVGKTTTELVQLLGNKFNTVAVGDRVIYIFPDLGIRVPVVNGRVVAGQ
jgi:hypothetical protein